MFCSYYESLPSRISRHNLLLHGKAHSGRIARACRIDTSCGAEVYDSSMVKRARPTCSHYPALETLLIVLMYISDTLKPTNQYFPNTGIEVWWLKY